MACAKAGFPDCGVARTRLPGHGAPRPVAVGHDSGMCKAGFPDSGVARTRLPGCDAPRPVVVGRGHGRFSWWRCSWRHGEC